MAKVNTIMACPGKLMIAGLAKAFDVEVDTSCDKTCAWYRSGTRFYEATGQTEFFESCAMNVIADSSENQVQTTHAMQAETGEMKNIMHYLTALASGAMSKGAVADTLTRMSQRPNETKQIGG